MNQASPFLDAEALPEYHPAHYGYSGGESCMPAFRRSSSLLLASLSLLFAAPSLWADEVDGTTDTQSPAPLEVRNYPSPAPIFSTNSTNDVRLDDMLQDGIWGRVRQGFQMREVDSPLVREQEAWLVARPEYLKRVTDRARRYLYHIVEELDKRGMPTELALLPIVESSYNPTAYSRAHASGLWQFIPSTGKTYGLEQTYWYDGRRDVLAATDAAMNYFSYLYSLFGDWELVLASYNWGEGAVARAVAKNRDKGLPVDYWSINMPAETRNYVPKLLALRNIIAHPERYGVQLADIPNRPYFVSVAPNRHMDTKLAAQLAGMSVEEFTNLNPAYTKPVIASKDSRRILLPVEKADTFIDRLASYDRPTLSWQAYGPARGEKLADIAARYNTTVEELKRANKLAANARVATGQILLVPMKPNNGQDDDSGQIQLAAAPEKRDPMPLAPPVRTNLPKVLVASVKPQPADPRPAVKETVIKETVQADVQPVPPPEPRNEGGLMLVSAEPSTFRPVQMPSPTITPTAPRTVSDGPRGLIVDENAAPVVKPVEKQAARSAVSVHTVAKGDTIYNIAQRYSLSVQELKQLNGMRSDRITLGQHLKVTAPAGKPETKLVHAEKEKAPQPKATVYTVRRGDTLYSIAQRHNVAAEDLKRWNNLGRHIQPGDQVKILLTRG